MSEQNTPPSGAETGNSVIAWIVACLLIGSLGYRLLTAAHEYPMRTEQVMTMVLDALLVIGVIGMRARIGKALFWVAFICGLGLFAIRLNGEASWWTGHLVYTIPPR
jgi:hypothetical protein